jgi:hypothetical protein
MYLTSSDCVIGCGKNSHDDDCARARSAQVLETVYLDHELAELNAMTDKDGVPRVEDGTYVLDIDLDYFHLERAIEPRDPATFYRLVRNAAAITIATEPDYVEDCRIKGSHVTGESLLARMKQHIELALS